MEKLFAELVAHWALVRHHEVFFQLEPLMALSTSDKVERSITRWVIGRVALKVAHLVALHMLKLFCFVLFQRFLTGTRLERLSLNVDGMLYLGL